MLNQASPPASPGLHRGARECSPISGSSLSSSRCRSPRWAPNMAFTRLVCPCLPVLVPCVPAFSFTAWCSICDGARPVTGTGFRPSLAVQVQVRAFCWCGLCGTRLSTLLRVLHRLRRPPPAGPRTSSRTSCPQRMLARLGCVCVCPCTRVVFWRSCALCCHILHARERLQSFRSAPSQLFSLPADQHASADI